MFGGFFFIVIFLSIIFIVGAVLVIYYKQISEGYEDRERFVILQKVGLDQKQIKQTINKQVLTVFFLHVIFSFIHLAFSYHILNLILKVIEVVDTAINCNSFRLWCLCPYLCFNLYNYFKKLS